MRAFVVSAVRTVAYLDRKVPELEANATSAPHDVGGQYFILTTDEKIDVEKIDVEKIDVEKIDVEKIDV